MDEKDENIELENELNRRDIQFEELFNNAIDAVFFIEVSEEGIPKCFIEVNDTACTILEYSKEELLRISLLDVLDGEYGRKEVLNMSKQLLEKKQGTFEIPFLSKNGRKIPVEASIHSFDFNGKKTFLAIVRDVTEKNNLERILRESGETHRQIIDLSPEAILITVDEIIVLANKQACKLVGIDYSEIIGKTIHWYIPNFENIISKRMMQTLKERRIATVYDYRIIRSDHKRIDVEVSSSYLNYKGKGAIQWVVRDVTERKKELNRAAQLQKRSLQKTFPLPNKGKVETVYVAAKTVSGDFYILEEVNENVMIGIIADVSGKGISAALNISAFNVLFREALILTQDPFEIIYRLNEKVVDYLGERYVAACCFSLDFKENTAKIVGAGINQFIFQHEKGYEDRIVKGPFLGMFEDSIFEEKDIIFQSGDKFYFYSDGLDFILDNHRAKENHLKTSTTREFKYYVKNVVKDKKTDVGGLKDDCTMVAIEIQ